MTVRAGASILTLVRALEASFFCGLVLATLGGSYAASQDVPEETARELTAHQREILDRELREQSRREKKDRSEYVRAAPFDFRPENIKRKLRLTLVPESRSIRAGQRFRYRVVLQNVGREKVSFFEAESFLKSGNITKDFRFVMAGPSGRWSELEPPVGRGLPGGTEVKIPGAAAMSEEQSRKTLEEMNYQAQHEFELGAELSPGESLVSRKYGGAFGSFRELVATDAFVKPGRYRLRLIYENSPPLPPTEQELQEWGKRSHSRKKLLENYARQRERAFGRIESDIVDIEVVP